MGMFDYIHIDDEVELPNFDGDKRKWQTKEFSDPFMDEYKITEDGRLLQEVYDAYTVPKEDRQYPDADEEEEPFKALAGSMGKKNEEWVDTEYHGTVEFHGVVDDYYHSFVAKFTDGELVEINHNGER